MAIPLALEHTDLRVVLTELPQALRNIRPFLVEHGVDRRIELMPLDALKYPWSIPTCDGIFIGNFLHAFSDENCHQLCVEAFRHLSPGGKLWLHEMIWNANKDGPLIVALYNAAIRNGPGRQRTACELMAILESAGFVDPYAVPTTGAFSLIAAHKPSD